MSSTIDKGQQFLTAPQRLLFLSREGVHGTIFCFSPSSCLSLDYSSIARSNGTRMTIDKQLEDERKPQGEPVQAQVRHHTWYYRLVPGTGILLLALLTVDSTSFQLEP